MNLKFLESFIWVAKLHSFSLAADKLHSTQAAISSRIAVLEQELGAKLFTRDPKGVALTRAGERVLQHAEQVIESMARLRASLQDEKFAPGTVRVGAMDSAIHTWFVDFVSTVTQTYPHLDIEVTSETALNLNDQLRRGMLDIVFQTDLLRDETIRSASLLELPIGWVAAPSLALRAGGAKPIAALRLLVEQRLITFSRHSRPHQDLMRFLQSHGFSDAKVSCVNSVAAMIKLTQGGFGVAAMPPALVHDLLRQSHLQLFEDFETPPPMPFVAAWRVSSERIERLVDIARQTAREYMSSIGNDLGAA